MSDFEMKLAHSPSVFSDLEKIGRDLASAIREKVGGFAEVKCEAADHDDENYSQNLVVKAEGGEIEVMVLWSKDEEKAEVSVGSAATARGAVAYIPVILALGFGFVFDKHPEWLPILRGIRVMLGAVVGFIAGTVLLALVGLVVATKKGKIDPKITENIDAAVRGVLERRGFSAA